jgi:hypothetical protein
VILALKITLNGVGTQLDAWGLVGGKALAVALYGHCPCRVTGLRSRLVENKPAAHGVASRVGKFR